MATKRRRTVNVLTGKTASVAIQRNGLSIEVGDVPAVDAALVAKCLLDAIRGLQAAGYEELVIDAGAVHGGIIEVPDEVDGDDFVLPPESKRRIGFIA
jgi:hypothetical protein